MACGIEEEHLLLHLGSENAALVQRQEVRHLEEEGDGLLEDLAADIVDAAAAAAAAVVAGVANRMVQRLAAVAAAWASVAAVADQAQWVRTAQALGQMAQRAQRAPYLLLALAEGLAFQQRCLHEEEVGVAQPLAVVVHKVARLHQELDHAVVDQRQVLAEV